MTPKQLRDAANTPWEGGIHPPNVDADLTKEPPEGYHRYPMWVCDCYGSRVFWVPCSGCA